MSSIVDKVVRVLQAKGPPKQIVVKKPTKVIHIAPTIELPSYDNRTEHPPLYWEFRL